LGGENPQRFRKRCAEVDRLAECGNDTAEANKTCPLRQVFERLTANRRDTHFRRRRGELLSDVAA
jgi:hypothetical protein